MSGEASKVVTASAAVQRKAESGHVAVWWSALLWGIWLLWFVLLVGGFVLGIYTSDEGPTARSHIPTPMRMGSSVALVAAALVAAAGRRHRVEARFLGWIATGMAFGLLGDLFNADLLAVGLPNPVLGGIVSFGLGHVAYILACLDAQKRLDTFSGRTRSVSLVVWLLIGVAGWAAIVSTGSENQMLRWPALPYSLLLATTTGMMTALALTERRFAPMALGAALFLFSDMVLAFELFHGSFVGAGDLVWLTYGPGQMLIVYGAAHVSGALWPRRNG